MRLLITRPKDDAEAFAVILRMNGHRPVVASVMEVRTHMGTPLELEGVQAILTTSANGVRTFAQRTERRDVPIYAVGPQTAEVARGAGFLPVYSADGDSKALADMVMAQLDPAKGKLWHAAGAETAGKLRQTLHGAGFAVEGTVLYEAVPVTELPAVAVRSLRGNALDGVMLFSPRSAKAFAELTINAGLAESCAGLDAFCISTATAEALKMLSFARVAVAGNPNQKAMLALIPEPEAGS